MARAALKLVEPTGSENSRRARRVFSVRLTDDQRAVLEEAAHRKYPHVNKPLGRFVQWALTLAADQVLGRSP